MLGSEYNWLVNLTYNLDGVPKVSLTRSGLFTLFIAIFCFLCIALQAGPPSTLSYTEPGLEMGPSHRAEIRITPNLAGQTLLGGSR
jgi:hypothetical protein